MRARGRKAARTKQAGNGGSIQANGSSIVEVPVEVLHNVLGMLSPHDLINVLQTSKAMAREVMHCSAGRLTLSVQLNGRAKLAAIRQLLQCAPPSTLKLKLNGYNFLQTLDPANKGWGMLSSLFGTPCTASPSNSQPGQHMQPCPGILAIHMENFALPGLLPPGLAAPCSNMHTLHLSNCTIHSGSDDSSTNPAGDKDNSGQTSGSSSNGIGYPACNLMMTKSLPAVAQRAEQLKQSLPGVTCLKLQDCPQEVQLLSAFGPQLQELHLLDELRVGPLPLGSVATHLQQLQKLVMPFTRPESDADVKLLLSLPNLTHLEIDGPACAYKTDYSNHPCMWQYLHLHLYGAGLYLDTLAKLPLHSLTHPLRLGREGDECVEVLLPPISQEDDLPSLERLAQQMTRCGVQLGDRHVMFVDEDGKAAPSLAIIAPAMGPQAHVGLSDMAVDQPILEVLASVYGSSLEQLELLRCYSEEDMQDAWHVALSGLPSLHRLTQYSSQGTKELVRALAAAMAQQPAGRCIELVLCCVPSSYSEALAASVMNGVEQDLVEVHIVVKDVVGHSDNRFKDLCVHITRVHMP